MSNVTSLRCVSRAGCPNPRLCAEEQRCCELRKNEALASNEQSLTLCLQAVMAELADLLEADQFNRIEAIVLRAGVPYPPLGTDPRTLLPVETTADLATQLGRARQLLEDWLAGHDFDVEAWAPRVRDFLENSNPFNLANRCTCEVSSDAKSIRCTVYVDCPVHGGAPTPTATCPNCGTVDEFSVRHCDPDEVGAVYPVIECHACGQKWSDWRGEDARTAAIESAQKSNEKPSASTDDHVTPSREPPPSSVECPKCRTQLAFEGDECGLCKEEE